MQLTHFKKDAGLRLGIKTAKGILDVEAAISVYNEKFPVSMEEVIENGEKALQQLQSLLDKALTADDSSSLFLAEQEIQFGPVVTRPEKIVCVGFNYVNHVEETKVQIPTSPILFSKFNNALTGHKEVVNLPEAAKQVDYEAELVMVVGKTAKNVSEEDALSYVFGYTTGNDLSARDLQFKTSQFLLGKTCDQFAPNGPFLVTSDEIPDPNHLEVKCTVNGELRQSGNTQNMIFSCATILSYVSQHMTLQPGDLIFTGTPDGVILGYPENEQQWLKAGDEITVTIEKIGSLTNKLA